MSKQVIGAGRGVGKEIALQLAQLGASVACVDVNPETGQATANRAQQLSGNARFYMCDVTNERHVFEAIQAATVELGEVTMLLHCCGVPSPRALAQDPAEIRNMMDISILSHFWVSMSPVASRQRVIVKGLFSFLKISSSYRILDA